MGPRESLPVGHKRDTTMTAKDASTNGSNSLAQSRSRRVPSWSYARSV